MNFGSYGGYVWASLGLCALVAVLEPWRIHRRSLQARHRAAQEAQAREPGKGHA